MDSKLALSAEIATYRRLLQAEENRSREGTDAAAPKAAASAAGAAASSAAAAAATSAGKGPAPTPPKGEPIAPTR